MCKYMMHVYISRFEVSVEIDPFWPFILAETDLFELKQISFGQDRPKLTKIFCLGWFRQFWSKMIFLIFYWV